MKQPSKKPITPEMSKAQQELIKTPLPPSLLILLETRGRSSDRVDVAGQRTASGAATCIGHLGLPPPFVYTTGPSWDRRWICLPVNASQPLLRSLELLVLRLHFFLTPHLISLTPGSLLHNSPQWVAPAVVVTTCATSQGVRWGDGRIKGVAR